MSNVKSYVAKFDSKIFFNQIKLLCDITPFDKQSKYIHFDNSENIFLINMYYLRGILFQILIFLFIMQ